MMGQQSQDNESSAGYTANTIMQPPAPLPQPAPLPGQSSSRNSETELAYSKRALGFIARAGRELGLAEPSMQVVAAHALQLRNEWTKATWRQMKACLVFHFGELGTAESRAAATLLAGVDQSECASKSIRTSGRRAKSVSAEDFGKVLDLIMSSGSVYSGLLYSWMQLGSLIGIRPHEWTGAVVIKALPEDVGDHESKAGVLTTYLRVQNGKSTNGRSHGSHRHLNLREMLDYVDGIQVLATYLSRAHAEGRWDKVYRGCQKLLYRINTSLHPNSPKRWVQLYSSRHRFSSEVKKRYGRAEVAALMGHATNQTATRHYGRRSAAGKSVAPLPVAAEVNRIRLIRGYQRQGGQANNQAPKSIPGSSSKA